MIRLDPYVIATLMPDLVGHDRRPAAFLVYLHLYAVSDGGDRGVEVGLADLALGTGLSKRAVQDAVKTLARRRLVEVTKARPTDRGTFVLRQPWRTRGKS